MRSELLACRIFVVAILFFASACSTMSASRSPRVGWLESLDRAGRRPVARRTASVPPAKPSEQQPEVRKGLLQQPGSLHLEPFHSPDLESVRMARWERVAESMELSWPLSRVQVTSEFGVRGGDLHEGIDLRASSGTPVLAAHDGTILYAGSGISGYGKLVVIKHSSGLSTVYGHNSKLLVRKGQRVRRGQRIALSGSTGRSSGPHLHFEVRTGLKPVDPRKLIAARGTAGKSSRRLPVRPRSTLAATERLR